MDPYVQNLLNQYQARLNPQPQKTPQQIAEEQKVQAYNHFITTPEGAAALNEVQLKFNDWYAAAYGTKSDSSAKEVSELKVMMQKMAEQNELMAKQLESLNNQLK